MDPVDPADRVDPVDPVDRVDPAVRTGDRLTAAPCSARQALARSAGP